MLEKPDLPDEKILTCLQEAFRLRPSQIEFLPVGADQNTAVYKVWIEGGKVYFVKLRSGNFNQIVVELPEYLQAQGVEGILAPLRAASGQLWVDLENYRLILYPFVEGSDGYKVSLTKRQWVDFGTAIRGNSLLGRRSQM